MTSNPSGAEPADARTEYSRRLADCQQRAANLARAERRIGNWRLVVFVGGLLIGWLAFVLGVLSPLWLLVPLAAFIALVLAHVRVIAARKVADRAVQYYARGLARLEDRWAGGGASGERFADATHPYSGDLDLFGRGSLFELLCTARTAAGEETLAAWLCSPADAEEIGARQAAVSELRARLDLRQDLALLGAEVGSALHREALLAWAAAPALLPFPRLRIAAAVLVGCSAVALLGWAMGWIGPLPLLISLGAEAVLALALRARVQTVLRAVELPGSELGVLVQLLARMETESFGAARLRAIRTALDSAGVPPSRRIAQLERLINLIDARRNQLFAGVAPLLLWATQLAFAVEGWRAVSGGAVAQWLRAVGEFEALCALATYAYEQAEDPFPEVDAGGALFDAVAVGHPLLPRARCVHNDVRLAADAAVLVVSGSNMSGKSTLLRTIGINAVLAQAGAPVRAQRLRLSPLTVGTAMRIADSLQAGTSRFYAEIQRLRQLVDLAQGERPLLFLLDEILHGTNSHDRRHGAEAVVRGLLARGAVGLITTHDLSLASIADALAPRAANVHFEDHLENGRMSFDYRMRAGVVRKSNALELMRAVGLDV
jgi:hypothetical protein